MMRFALFILASASAAVSGAASPSGEEESRTIAASDGTVVHVYEYPPSPGGSGVPILMFHQAGGDARGELGPIARKLAAEGRRVFTADLRSGGDRFGRANLTAAGYRGAPPGYCDTYPDLDAALSLVQAKTGGPVIVAGSSYSAALVVKLAAARPRDVAAFVSFSPAGGDPMKGCEAELFLRDLRVPGLAVRNIGPRAGPAWLHESNRNWREAGLPVKEVVADGHGASLLLAERTKGDVDSVWAAFKGFLTTIDGRRDEEVDRLSPRSPEDRPRG